MKAARLALVLLASCAPFALDVDPTFTHEERTDIAAAVDAWDGASPLWRERIGAGVVHIRRVQSIPDHPTWGGATSTLHRTILLLPKRDELFRRMATHELGHMAGLGHVQSTEIPSIMHHEVDLDTDEPTERDVRALAVE